MTHDVGLATMLKKPRTFVDDEAAASPAPNPDGQEPRNDEPESLHPRVQVLRLAPRMLPTHRRRRRAWGQLADQPIDPKVMRKGEEQIACQNQKT